MKVNIELEIDKELLNNQLHNLYNISDFVSDKYKDGIEGIISLVEAIQDEVHKR